MQSSNNLRLSCCFWVGSDDLKYSWTYLIQKWLYNKSKNICLVLFHNLRRKNVQIYQKLEFKTEEGRESAWSDKKLCYRKICKFPPIPLIIILKLLSEESSRWIGWEGFLDSIVDDWFRGLNIKYFNLIDWYLIYRVAHQRLNFNYDLNLGKFWSLLVCSLVFLQWVCFRVSTGNFISVSAPEIWLFFSVRKECRKPLSERNSGRVWVSLT